MEEVEGANRSAVESCNKVLNLLSNPQVAQDQLQFRNLSMETGEAIGKFRKVASLLSKTLGHARAKISKNLLVSKADILLSKGVEFNRNEMVDHQIGSFLSLNSNLRENIVKHECGPSVTKSNVCSETPSLSLEIGLSYENKSSILGKAQPTSEQNRFQLLQHQRMQQHQLMKYRFQQQQQADIMFSKSNSGISLNFESSSCTPTMSSNRSFISSLSIDGSVANVNGGAFQYFGGGRSLDHSLPLQRKKCSGRGDNGSLKCGSSRCHCSKKK